MMGHTPEEEENNVRDRFHEVHNLRREHISTMDEYLNIMGNWMGERYKGMSKYNGKQLRFINRMANKDGIEGHIVTSETYKTKRDNVFTRFRDRITGHFVTRTGQEDKKETRKLGAGEGVRASRASKRRAEKQAKPREYAERQSVKKGGKSK